MAVSLLKLLSNAKTRTLVLLTGGVLCVGVVIAIFSAGKTGEPLENRQSKTSQVPKGVESTPGAKTSEKYKELQEKANTLGAEKAEKKGGTFIPTIVADNKNKAAEDLQSQFLKALEKTDTKESPPKPAIPTPKPDEADNLRKQHLSQINAEKMAALNEQKLKAIETVANAMDEQAKSAFSAWNDVPQQAFVTGDKQNEKNAGLTEANNKSKNNSNAIQDTRKVILKSGTILFAVLETAVNSDEPGPIMARIIQAPFKDAKLIGSIQLPPDNGRKISLQFDTINIPTEPTSSKISAVAIDPDTARTALASNVDNHYLSRWGSVFGSTFLSGYAKAITQSGTTVQSTTGAVGTSTTTQTPSLSGKQQIFAGLGAFGSKVGEQMTPLFNRKPTITINSGVGIGVLILTDVKLGPEPINTNQNANSNNAAAQLQKPTNSVDFLTAIMQNAAANNNPQSAQQLGAAANNGQQSTAANTAQQGTNNANP